jgi:hypothetical protein
MGRYFPDERIRRNLRCISDRSPEYPAGRLRLAVSMQSESSFEAIFLLAGYAEAGRVPTALQLG